MEVYQTAQKVLTVYSYKEKTPLGFLSVDFDTVFVNRIATELQYLAWVLKGEYEKPY